MDDKVFSSKTDSNTLLLIAIFSDFKESILKNSHCRCLIGNLIAFAIHISKIVESELEYYCYAYCSLLSLAYFFDSLEFIFSFLLS